MCLWANSNFNKRRKPSIARKDITCYKTLDYGLGGYCTPYRCMPFKEGLNIADGPQDYKYSACGIRGNYKKIIKVEGGYIHAYTTLENACNKRYYNARMLFVAECVIPKGTEYWRGFNGEICATQMVFKKIIEEDEP